MVDREFIGMLACPETGQTLTEAQPGTCRKTNDLIEKGKISDSDGNPVTETADGFLETADKSRLYPVKNGVPVLLAGKSILPPESPGN